MLVIALLGAVEALITIGVAGRLRRVEPSVLVLLLIEECGVIVARALLYERLQLLLLFNKALFITRVDEVVLRTFVLRRSQLVHRGVLGRRRRRLRSFLNLLEHGVAPAVHRRLELEVVTQPGKTVA